MTVGLHDYFSTNERLQTFRPAAFGKHCNFFFKTAMKFKPMEAASDDQ
jgi:urease beta subunit